jgi:hypothetical protein
MKKFLIFLLFLLILGGAGFFFGWAQFNVPLGTYGVMRSKTYGTEAELVRDGEIRWVWYKLIPTNVEILVFSPRLVNHSVKSSGSLPSGKLYASLAGLEADFSWEIKGDFSFSIKPEALPSLVLRENIANQQDLEALEDDYAARIETLVLRRLSSYGEDADKMDTLLFAAFLPEITREIEAVYPDLEKVNCRVQVIRFPDLELYRSVRGLYDEYLARQRRVLEDGVIRNAESNMGTRLRLDELEKYGEILTRYPILLQFLALERGSSSLFSGD